MPENSIPYQYSQFLLELPISYNGTFGVLVNHTKMIQILVKSNLSLADTNKCLKILSGAYTGLETHTDTDTAY